MPLDMTPDIVYLPPRLELVPAELLWHELASRYDTAIFAGVRDVHDAVEHVECAALGSQVCQLGLLALLGAYVETHAGTCDTRSDDDEGDED